MISLSPSSINLFLQCPFRYYLSKKYPDEKKTKRSEYIIIGDVVHKIIEEYYKQLSKELDSIDDFMIDLLVSHAKNKVLKDTNVSENRIQRYLDNFKIFEKKRLRKNKKVPMFVEKPFKIDNEFYGVIDFYDDGILIDFKTDTSQYPKESHVIQGNIYRYLLEKHGYNVKEIKFLFLYNGKEIKIPKKPDSYVLDILERVKMYISSNNYPKKPSNYCKYCEYRLYCVFSDYLYEELEW